MAGKLILIALVFFYIYSGIAHATLHNLHSDDNIQEVIDTAGEGDTLLFNPGVYTVDLIVRNRSLCLASLDLFDPVNPPFEHAGDTHLVGEDSEGNPSRCITFLNDSLRRVRCIGLSFTTAREADELDGGALYFNTTDVGLVGCVFTGGHGSVGGAVSLDSCRGTIENCLFQDNIATLGGGAVNIRGGVWTIASNTFRNNNVSWNEGGGLRAILAGGSLADNLFIGNSVDPNPTASFGGGVCIHGPGGVWDITGNVFIENLARAGGGLQVGGIDSVSIHENRFLANQTTSFPETISSGAGANIRSFEQPFLLINNVFIRNRSSYEAPAFLAAGQGIVEDNVVELNEGLNGSAFVLNSVNGVTSNIQVNHNLIRGNYFLDPRATQLVSSVHVQIMINAWFTGNDFIDNEICALAHAPRTDSFADAADNFWGDPSGPYQADQNPSGTGDHVDTSVNILPFATTPFVEPPPPRFTLIDTLIVWGSVEIGETDTLPVPCGNAGDYWLKVTPSVGDTVNFTPLHPVTWEIEPLDTSSIAVAFHPTHGGPCQTVLTLALDDPDCPSAEVVLLGVGTPFDAVDPAADGLPHDFSISPPYPNPFNDSATIHLTLPHEEEVHLRLVDLLGRTVRTVLEETMGAGEHRVTLDGHSLASGTYLLQVDFGASATLSRRIVHVK